MALKNNNIPSHWELPVPKAVNRLKLGSSYVGRGEMFIEMERIENYGKMRKKERSRLMKNIRSEMNIEIWEINDDLWKSGNEYCKYSKWSYLKIDFFAKMRFFGTL